MKPVKLVIATVMVLCLCALPFTVGAADSKINGAVSASAMHIAQSKEVPVLYARAENETPATGERKSTVPIVITLLAVSAIVAAILWFGRPKQKPADPPAEPEITEPSPDDTDRSE